ncbi:MAG: hypothetical protein HY304_01895 [candidate division Zixibacteria bacterium]|nr:hypothetical protein [candidate division Zixibacteria bacterium]
MSLKSIRIVFLLCGCYDIALGVIFGLFYPAIYSWAGVAGPNHPGYVQLSAMYVAVFGIGFLFVYRDPLANRAIVPLGFLMKLGFCVVAFGHMIFGTIPSFYVPLAVLDLITLGIFAVAWRSIRRAGVKV